MRLLILILLWFPSAFAFGGSLKNGWYERKLNIDGGSGVAIRAMVGPLNLSKCEGWRWGAEAECPKSALLDIAVNVDGDDVFVPRSAYADLGEPAIINLRGNKNSFYLDVKGGDAALAYVAVLHFSRGYIVGRKVFANEFKESAWETASYSFPK